MLTERALKPAGVEQLQLYLVGYGEDREIQARASIVEIVLHIWRNPIGALIQDHKTLGKQ